MRQQRTQAVLAEQIRYGKHGRTTVYPPEFEHMTDDGVPYLIGKAMDWMQAERPDFGIVVMDSIAEFFISWVASNVANHREEYAIFGDDSIVKPWMQLISPWESAFFECKVSSYIKDEDIPVLLSVMNDPSIGVFVNRFSMNDKSPWSPEFVQWIKDVEVEDDLQGAVAGEGLGKVEEAAWVQVHNVVLQGFGPYGGMTLALGLHVMTLDAKGVLLRDRWISYGESAVYRALSHNYEVRYEALREVCRSIMLGGNTVAMLACAFANVKNVVIQRKTMDPKLKKKHTKRLGHPPMDFSVVKIFPGSRSGSGGGASNGIMPFHPVRGHFAFYPNGLFGDPNKAGTYWIESHVRGNPNIGIKKTEYKTEVP